MIVEAAVADQRGVAGSAARPDEQIFDGPLEHLVGGGRGGSRTLHQVRIQARQPLVQLSTLIAAAAVVWAILLVGGRHLGRRRVRPSAQQGDRRPTRSAFHVIPSVCQYALKQLRVLVACLFAAPLPCNCVIELAKT